MHYLLRLISVLLFLPVSLAAQWAPVPQLPTEQFTALFADGDQLYAGGLNRVFHSPDGGATWDSSAVIFPELDYITDITVIDGIWYVATVVDGVWASVDAGHSWHAINYGLPGGGGLNPSMFARRDNYLYVSTNGAGVYRRPLSAGLSTVPWTSFNTQIPWYNVVSIVNIDGQLLAGAGGNATVARCAPGASSWTETPFDEFNGEISFFYDVVKVDAALIAAGSFGLYRSTDAGDTWSRFNNGFGYIAQASLARNAGSVYALLAKGSGVSTLGYSSNGGLNWQAFQPVVGNGSIALAAVNNRLFAGRLNGLWVIDLPTSPAPEPARPATLSHTIAPNPAAAQVSLRFQATGATEVQLRLYNRQGQLALTRDFGYLPAGDQLLEFDVQSLPTGVYVYEIKTRQGNAAGKLVVERS